MDGCGDPDPDGLRRRLLQLGSVYPADVLSLIGQLQPA